MNRREFLRTAGLVGGAAVVGGPTLLGLGDSSSASSTSRRSRAVTLAKPELSPDSVLNSPASECPVDTVVVLIMENRSFDHYFGWLGTDPQYLDEGRSRYGKDFSINGRVNVRYTNEEGDQKTTRNVRSLGDESNPLRGCLHKDPGHSWKPARVQRDRGFLASGSGNDEFAISYYEGSDIPVQTSLARRFTVMDQHHCSLLAPTWPNREYLYSAQSQGRKTGPKPLDLGQYTTPTIFDKLTAARVSSAEYFVNIPPVLIWGQRMDPYVRSMDVYFYDAAQGKLPNVTFLVPGMGVPFRTDDHPQGDIGFGQRFIQAVFSAFVRSPQWQRGMFVLTYDEWGGFFDHVKPPVLPDARASSNDQNNFGQAGFRVPTVLASPYAPRNYVDHRVYDHTSILRFLEWRFLGAPPEGPGSRGDKWFLTKRDQHANNFGASLKINNPELDVDLYTPLASIPQSTSDCDHDKRLREKGKDATTDTFQVSDRLQSLAANAAPNGSTFTPWVKETNVRDLPPMGDDRPR